MLALIPSTVYIIIIFILGITMIDRGNNPIGDYKSFSKYEGGQARQFGDGGWGGGGYLVNGKDKRGEQKN